MKGRHMHRLADVDSEARTATCASCGPVRVWPKGQFWRCAGASQPIGAERHSLSAIDPEQRQATCSICGPTTVYPKRRQSRRGEVKQFWQCQTPRKRVAGAAERRRLYGLTQEQFDAMLQAQDGRCAICKEPMGRVCTDHDHSTGEARGLLCLTCNAGLGQFHDDPDLLRSAIDYLEATRCHS